MTDKNYLRLNHVVWAWGEDQHSFTCMYLYTCMHVSILDQSHDFQKKMHVQRALSGQRSNAMFLHLAAFHPHALPSFQCCMQNWEGPGGWGYGMTTYNIVVTVVHVLLILLCCEYLCRNVGLWFSNAMQRHRTQSSGEQLEFLWLWVAIKHSHLFCALMHVFPAFEMKWNWHSIHVCNTGGLYCGS